MSVFRSVVCVFLAVIVASAGSLSAGEAVPACSYCGNSGHKKCTDCRGTGTSSKVPAKCPQCNGEKKVKCTHCDDKDMMDCSRKKKDKTINGKHMILNPVWEEYRKKNSSPFGIHEVGKPDDPNEPEQWILCPVCKGSGKVKCTYCNGSKKMDCAKCDGKGTVQGEGQCPTCMGTAQAPCEACAVVPEDAPEEFSKNLALLAPMLEKKLITADDYWMRRRLLVAKAKIAVAEAEKRARENERTRDLVAMKLQKRDDNAEEMKSRRQSLDMLITGLSSGAIQLDMYLAKRDALGLSEQTVRAVEEEAAKKNGIMKKFVQLQDRFKAGSVTYDQYLADLDKMKNN